jgi:hypothetical protein
VLRNTGRAPGRESSSKPNPAALDRHLAARSYLPRQNSDQPNRSVSSKLAVRGISDELRGHGIHRAGAGCDVDVDGNLLRIWIGDELVKTAVRTTTGTVRNKRVSRTLEQA